jgi:hypothetical protein
MTQPKLTQESGGTLEYHKWQKEQMAPRNISPEVMGKHKAMVFNAVMTGGFAVNTELAGWDGYTPDKKKLLISGFDDMADVKYILNVENDNEILAYALAKKREIETVAAMAAVPVK